MKYYKQYELCNITKGCILLEPKCQPKSKKALNRLINNTPIKKILKSYVANFSQHPPIFSRVQCLILKILKNGISKIEASHSWGKVSIKIT